MRAELNLEVPLDAFRPDSAPPHLHMNFRVVDEVGRQLAMGRNAVALKEEFGSRIKQALTEEISKNDGERRLCRLEGSMRNWPFSRRPPISTVARREKAPAQRLEGARATATARAAAGCETMASIHAGVTVPPRLNMTRCPWSFDV